jgi:8-oxo-dGTP diphosphatase
MQPEPDTRPAIAAAVIVQDGRVLLVQRRVSEGSLSWQFPAGEVEAGESGEEAGVRETAEETGLTVAALDFLGERVHPATKRTMLYVACEVLDGEAHVADAEELGAVAWVSRGDIAGYVPFPFYGPVQEYLNARLVPADV